MWVFGTAQILNSRGNPDTRKEYTPFPMIDGQGLKELEAVS
jgi:hypothetical protein